MERFLQELLSTEQEIPVSDANETIEHFLTMLHTLTSSEILELQHLLLRLERSCRRPLKQLSMISLSHTQYYTKQKDVCAICIQPYYQGISGKMSCSHSFCHHCIYQWMKQGYDRNKEMNCPLCRVSCQHLTIYIPKEKSGIRVIAKHKEIRKQLVELATNMNYSSISLER
jgi:Ring finger domain